MRPKVDAREVAEVEVKVVLRAAQRTVPELFGDEPQVAPATEHVRGAAMAKEMRPHVRRKSGRRRPPS